MEILNNFFNDLDVLIQKYKKIRDDSIEISNKPKSIQDNILNEISIVSNEIDTNNLEDDDINKIESNNLKVNEMNNFLLQNTDDIALSFNNNTDTDNNFDFNNYIQENFPMPNNNRDIDDKILKYFNSKLNMDTKDINIINNPKIIFFYSPSCPACIKTKPLWDFVINNINKFFINKSKSFDIFEVNITDPNNKDLCDKYNIEYIPTLILENNKNLIKEEGMMNLNTIISYIIKFYESL